MSGNHSHTSEFFPFIPFGKRYTQFSSVLSVYNDLWLISNIFYYEIVEFWKLQYLFFHTLCNFIIIIEIYSHYFF